jgi:hypothetical protein
VEVVKKRKDERISKNRRIAKNRKAKKATKTRNNKSNRGSAVNPDKMDGKDDSWQVLMLELKHCQLNLEQEKWDDQKQHQQQQHDLDHKFGGIDYFFVFVVVGGSGKFFVVGGSGIDYFFVSVVIGGSGSEKGVVHNLLPLFPPPARGPGKLVTQQKWGFTVGVFNIELFTLFIAQFDRQCPPLSGSEDAVEKRKKCVGLC